MIVVVSAARHAQGELRHLGARLWARDSPKVKGAPGKTLDLKAVPAPNEAAAAQYYPAIYWWSMLKGPGRPSSFLGLVRNGNGMPVTLKDQGLMAALLEDGRLQCLSSAGRQGDARASGSARTF